MRNHSMYDIFIISHFIYYYNIHLLIIIIFQLIIYFLKHMHHYFAHKIIINFPDEKYGEY